MVNGSEIIDIVEIAYFAPALPLSIYICVKHGFSREAGWLLITILSIIRIVGASCGVAAARNYDQTLVEVSMIMSSIGSATLVAVFTGITNRIADGSKGSPLSSQQRRLLQIIGIVAIVLGIVGGTKISETNTSSSYLKAAVILILVQFLASCFVLGSCAIHFRHILDVDRKLFFCVAFATPFLFVRVIYSILSAFDSHSSTFSLLSTAVVAIVVRACLAVAMEIISVSLFLLGGLVAPKMSKGQRSTEATPSIDSAQAKEQYIAPNTQYSGTTRQ